MQPSQGEYDDRSDNIDNIFKANETKPQNADDVSNWLYHNNATKPS
jgi:hypothetical protein